MDQAAAEIAKLSEKIKGISLPEKLSEMVLVRLNQLSKLTASPTFLPEFDRMDRYIDWIVNLPWQIKTQDNLDLGNAKAVLDKYHYGLGDIKERILEYMSVMKLKSEKGEGADIYRAPILCFVGLVGTGKTTIASSIAEALGRKFARIPFGGMGDPLDLRGQSKMHAEAEPGKVIKSLRNTKSRNTVILLDEIDRVTDEGRASIMGVLVELLDPRQNHEFVDHYVDYPFNLSEVLFIATANNTTNISTAVMDRLEPIGMPSYTDEEKITIGSKYVLPKAMKASGLPESALSIDDDVWANVVRPLGYDAGIRTLERNIDGIVRKVSKLIVEGKGKSFRVTSENAKQFLPQ
ncbi:AAA family ATPase [Patescibacteria group bacterium]